MGVDPNCRGFNFHMIAPTYIYITAFLISTIYRMFGHIHVLLQLQSIVSFTMRRASKHFVLITFTASQLVVFATLCSLPSVGSFCSADRFCDGGEDDKEYLHKNLEESIKIERAKREREVLVEELVRKQFEDFPSPEVTLEQLEDERQR